jgi:homoserine kinase
MPTQNRAAPPRQFSREDVVFNVSRVALLVAALAPAATTC